MTKGNNGKAARRRTAKQLACLTVCVVMVCSIVFLCFRGGGGYSGSTKIGIPMNGVGGGGRRLGGGGHKNKQQQRRASHHRHQGDTSGSNLYDETDKDPHEVAVRFRQDLLQQAESRDEVQMLEDILEGRLNLVDIMSIDEELERSPEHSYAGVYGSFCKLNFAVHKANPSSDGCENPVQFDLKKVVYLAKQRDKQVEESDTEQVPKVLNFTAAAFHESRCGSTLVANSMIAMDPIKHRTYSESSPPINAMKGTCGPMFDICSEEKAARILQDVIYMMSRTDDPKEERVFFKFQSITSQSISTFQLAFPKVPWMYVYREPVQVMMSHVKDDPKLSRAICTRTMHGRHPTVIKEIAHRHGYADSRELEGEQYCAAHLASLTESAVKNLNGMAIPVNYEKLPNMMWEKIMPKVFGRPLSQKEIDNMESVSHEYSKGRGSRAGEFKGDSEKKVQAASTEVKEAAEEFLKESYDTLNAFQPKLLQ
ncbi:MAG: hypothetical protein SGARI_000826 [Bacillariaceae sp.]